MTIGMIPNARQGNVSLPKLILILRWLSVLLLTACSGGAFGVAPHEKLDGSNNDGFGIGSGGMLGTHATLIQPSRDGGSSLGNPDSHYVDDGGPVIDGAPMGSGGSPGTGGTMGSGGVPAGTGGTPGTGGARCMCFQLGQCVSWNFQC
jgi:hypothetical protein